MQTITYFYPEGHSGHAQAGHAEQPERVEVIRASLEAAGLWQLGSQIPAAPIPEDILHAIHRPAMLERLREHSRAAQPIDTDTYMTPASWPLALNAAGGAAALAGAVWRREAANGFALTRPPGHHATRSHPMGFCLLNNVALAAESLRQHEGAKRLAIIDLDVHHGNGTQDIFYEREDVFFISSHQVPLYPGSGQLNERGIGPGEGTIANIPLPPSSGDEAFRSAYHEIVPALLDRFQPQMLLVSLGFDAHWKDPLANLLASARAYGEAIQSLRQWAQSHCDGRIALFLEGGYDLDAAAACGLAAVQGLLDLPISDSIGPSPTRQRDDWKPVFETIRRIWNIA